MILLILAKRVKVYKKDNVYKDEYKMSYLELFPITMLLSFILIIMIALFLAKLNFINETLVLFAFVCILLFTCMFKLVLHETRGLHV